MKFKEAEVRAVNFSEGNGTVVQDDRRRQCTWLPRVVGV